MKPVVVAGAGISGLALACELERLAVPVVVLEAEARAGGKIESDHRDGYLCERGPASFRDRAGEMATLAERLGLASRWLSAGDAAARRLVVARGRLHDTPGTAAAFAASQLLPWPAKLRAGLDLVLPRGASAAGQDESVAAFGRRRLGRLGGERLLEPLVSGLYAGNPEEVSLPAAFPLVAAMERERRSFLLAMRAEFAKASQKTAPRLASFRGGLDELTSALATRLGQALRLGWRVQRIEKSAAGFRLAGAEGGQTRALEASAVALAIPAHVATGLLAPFDAHLADALAAIPYVPVALVHLGYPASTLPPPLPAYGFFVPPSERLRALGGIFPSQFFAGRAPVGHHLFSVRMGGARDRGALALSDEELAEVADRELRALVGLAAAPTFIRVVRHQHALPQYTLGHLGRLAALAAGEDRHPGLFFHGNAYYNAGVPELVSRSGKLAARIAAFARGES